MVIPLPVAPWLMMLLLMKPWICASLPIAVALMPVEPRIGDGVVVDVEPTREPVLTGLKLMPGPLVLVTVTLEMSTSMSPPDEALIEDAVDAAGDRIGAARIVHDEMHVGGLIGS